MIFVKNASFSKALILTIVSGFTSDHAKANVKYANIWFVELGVVSGCSLMVVTMIRPKRKETRKTIDWYQQIHSHSHWPVYDYE